MVKRVLFTVGGLGLLTVLLFGRNATSYVRTSAGWVKESVKDCVPIGFEIDRARRMVKDLVPDIRKNMHVIAQEEVELERLEKRIASAEKNLTKDREEVLKLKSDLTSGLVSYQYSGKTYSEKQVKMDLTNRFERFKTNDATLASLREIQAARRRSLEAARQKLEGMLASKRQLEVDVENLEAKLKMIEVAQTTSNYNFDDSQLGRAKELIGDVRTRLSVAERLVDVDSEMQGEIPVSTSSAEDIIEQVSEYFSPAADQVAETK